MELKSREISEITIIEIHGILDTATSGEAEKQISEILSRGCQKMIIDLEDTDYMSSSGLRVLLSTAKKLWARDGKLKITSPNKIVKDILDTSGFSVIMEVRTTTQEALQEFDQ